ncbi:hypothetical protein [Virgifigura deserti]|uniref:hypothetical protein n=1 Tax=Virgifigura deserti TaxID=2268457 RepID=UPI003CCC2587
MRYEILALALTFITVLWLMHRRHRATIKQTRTRFFDACLPLFDSYRVTQDDIDFPVLAGHYRGYRVRLEPIVDHVAVRKLPSLWLLVTVHGEVPYKGIVDLLARPLNTEFFSPSAGLDTAIEIPPGWPPHASLRTNAPEQMPPMHLLTPHIAIFDDPKTKELLVTPRGVRIVYQANQATRAHYLVLRQAEFKDVAVPAALVQRLLDQAIAVHQTLADGRTEGSRQNERHDADDRRHEPALAV